MFPRVSPQTHRRSRRGVVAPLIVLLAATTAATQQQDSATAARVRAARMRAAAGRLDTAAARIRAKTQIPPAQTADGPQVPTITMPRLIGLDTLGAIRVLRSRKMFPYVILPPASGLIARDEIAAQDPAPDSPYTYRTPSTAHPRRTGAAARTGDRSLRRRLVEKRGGAGARAAATRGGRRRCAGDVWRLDRSCRQSEAGRRRTRSARQPCGDLDRARCTHRHATRYELHPRSRAADAARRGTRDQTGRAARRR